MDISGLKSDGTVSGTSAEPRIIGEELWWPPPSASGMAVSEATSLQLPAILATLITLATDIAVLPLDVYRKRRDGTKEVQNDHPVADLLRRSPDGGETTPIKFRMAWMGHALQYGNGYAEIQRRGDGTPYALHLLDPESTHPERRGNKLVYRLGDANRTLAYGNVLHLAGFGFDGLCGYNVLKLIRQGIGMGLAAEAYASDYFANDATPGGYLEHPGKLGVPARQNLREDFNAKHQGQGRHHVLGILEEGMKYQSVTGDPERAQLVEARKFQVNDVTRPFRVPPNKIGDYSEAHLSNIEASNLDYLKTALVGWLESIEQIINLRLLSDREYRQGYYVEHNTLALERGDTAGRYSAYQIAVSNGWMSRDEVRSRENMNPIGEAGGGNLYTVQAQMTRLADAGVAFDAGPVEALDGKVTADRNGFRRDFRGEFGEGTDDPGDDDDDGDVFVFPADDDESPILAAKRMNTCHGPDGTFCSGGSGGMLGGHGGGGEGGDISVAGEKWSDEKFDQLGSEVKAQFDAKGQDVSIEHGPPTSDREQKLLDKAEAKERFLVKNTGKPTTEEVKTGPFTEHKVGGEAVAMTTPNPAGEGYISRQKNARAPGGFDDFEHPTEAKALKDSRSWAKEVEKSQSYVEYKTPRNLQKHFADELDSSIGLRNTKGLFTTTYKVITP